MYGVQSARDYVHCLNVTIGLGRVYHPHLPDREAEGRDVVGQGHPGNCSSVGLELTAAWLLLHSSAWCLNIMTRNALFLGGRRQKPGDTECLAKGHLSRSREHLAPAWQGDGRECVCSELIWHHQWPLLPG